MKNLLIATRPASRLQAFAAAAAIFMSCASTFATTYTWTGSTSQLWSAASNWSGSIRPVAGDTTDIVFGPTTQAGTYQDLGNPFQLHSLTFNANGQNLSGNPLTFSVPGSIQQNSSTATIFNDLNLSADVTVNAAGTTNLYGVLIGFPSTHLIKNGAGSLFLNGSNTFTGYVDINAGQVVLGGFGDGVKNSIVNINVNNGLNLNNQPAVSISGLTGSGSLNIGATRLDIGGRISPLAPPYNGTITGTTGAVHVGYGPASLGGSNSSFHHLEVEGDVILDGTLSYPNPSITVSSGRPITFADDNALTVGTPHLTPPLSPNLTVRNGAILNTIGDLTNGTTLVGGSVTQPSTFRITGAGSRWRAGSFNYIGGRIGAGSLIVEAGGAITDAYNLSIGAGNVGAGSMLVQTEGTVRTARGILASEPGSIGSATITGSGSTWTNSLELDLGGYQVIGGAGTLNVNDNGAVIVTGLTSLYTASSSINVNGGTFTTDTIYGDVGTFNLSDPAGGSALTINGVGGIATYAGAIHGTGGIHKSGGSIQFLTGDNTWLGPTTVDGGTLVLPTATSTSYTVNSGGILTLGFANLDFSSLHANPGSVIHYNSPILVGGYLYGGGTHDIAGVTSFNGTTFGVGVNLNLLGTTLNSVTNSGALTVNGVNWNGGYNTAAGSIAVFSSLNVNGFENTGAITINGRSSLINSATNLVSGGGGRITINSQGAISLQGGTTLNLNGSLLINNGSITGTTNVNFGALAKGSGVYGPVNVNDGGRFSPGNSPGSVTTGSTTWNSGGSYLVEISDALAGPGIGWDTWNINGILNLNAGNTSNAHFTIYLSSLDTLASNFHPTHDYTWPILQASDGLTPFDPSSISLDTSSFKNPLAAGHFSLESTPTTLTVHFSALPEPANIAFLAFTVLFTSYRRRF